MTWERIYIIGSLWQETTNNKGPVMQRFDVFFVVSPGFKTNGGPWRLKFGLGQLFAMGK